MELIETGKIVNTHGLRGELKVEQWSDSPEIFCTFPHFFIDNIEYIKERARVQKGFVILKLKGIDTIDSAEALKNKILFIPRSSLPLDDGACLISDLVGLRAVDESGAELGKIDGILTLPGGEVLEIHGKREILVPLVDEFVLNIDLEAGAVTLKLIEGM